MTANERPGVDAGWRVLFAFQYPWPRVTQGGRPPMNPRTSGHEESTSSHGRNH
jgi:hypothetical protein